MAKRPKPVPQMTTAQFEDRFPVGDDEACLRYLVARRWPQGVHCPRCGNTTCTTPLATSRFIGSAAVRARRLSVLLHDGHDF